MKSFLTRKNLIVTFCGVVLGTIALNIFCLIDNNPVNVRKVPNGVFVDGVRYQVIINMDKPIDEDLLESYIKGALSNYHIKE